MVTGDGVTGRSDAPESHHAAHLVRATPRQPRGTRPEHLAVTDEHRTVDRTELERLANRIAHTLESLGVATGDFVTIALPNSVEFVATVVACWKLGATPQPVSSRLPKRELDAIVELADPR